MTYCSIQITPTPYILFYIYSTQSKLDHLVLVLEESFNVLNYVIDKLLFLSGLFTGVLCSMGGG